MRSEWRLTHEPRRIDALEPLALHDWRLKVYGICGLSRPIPKLMLDAATQIALENLPAPSMTSARYGVGFLIAHEAHAFNTITLDWWENVNELRHKVFRASSGRHSFTDITASAEAACVWELRIMAFERDAWVDSVLEKGKMDFDRYNSTMLSGLF